MCCVHAKPSKMLVITYLNMCSVPICSFLPTQICISLFKFVLVCICAVYTSGVTLTMGAPLLAEILRPLRSFGAHYRADMGAAENAAAAA